MEEGVGISRRIAGEGEASIILTLQRQGPLRIEGQQEEVEAALCTHRCGLGSVRSSVGDSRPLDRSQMDWLHVGRDDPQIVAGER